MQNGSMRHRPLRIFTRIFGEMAPISSVTAAPCRLPLGGEGLGKRIVTGGNPWKGLHQCALHYGMTATGSHSDFDSLRGAPLVRNDMRDTAAPTGAYEGSWGNGLGLIRHGCAVPPSPGRGRLGEAECHTSAAALVRNDMRYFRTCSYYAAFPASPDRPAEAP